MDKFIAHHMYTAMMVLQTHIYAHTYINISYQITVSPDLMSLGSWKELKET